jgi:VanZ family protein
MRSLYTTTSTASGLALPLALVYCGLVLYASLYPFVGWQSQGVMPWAFALARWPQYWSGFDVAINVVGYVPLGFLLRLAISNAWQRPALLTVVMASLLSFGMEALQTYLSPRVASNVDWGLNTLGALVGVMLAWMADGIGFLRSWQRWREGRFEAGSGIALGLLVLWPLALLYPTPVPLGLGHGLGQLLDLQTQDLPDKLETLVIALGLLTPMLLAYAVTPQWSHRVTAWLLMSALGFGVTALTHGLSFGPELAGAWLQSPTQYGFGLGVVLGAALTLVNHRFCWLLAFICIVPHLTLQSTVGLDPYFAQTLALWEGGQFIRFYGATQYLGWFWPYAALILVMTRMTQLLQLRDRN